MAEDEGTEPTPPLPPPGDDEQQTRLPKSKLKTPPKREDIPSLQSTLSLMKHDFSSRQRQLLAGDKGYEAITKKCGHLSEKPRKLALCCSRELCPKEYVGFIACIRTTRDPSMCHEFRDEIERCGARASQRLLRAALADDWF
eukprot:g18510.t1